MERINFDFKVLQELPIVDLLQAIWHKVMNLRYERQRQSNAYTEQYTPYCLSKFNAHRIPAQQYQVQIASPTEGRIAENTLYGTRYHHVHL